LTDKEYKLVKYPLRASARMDQWAEQAVGGLENRLEKAKHLFNVLTRGIRLRNQVSFSHLQTPCTAEKAFQLWSDPAETLTCQEFTFLYVALARSAGLDAYYVLVRKDHQGRLTHHACAGINLEGKAIMIDPAFLTFGINHQEYKFLDDVQTTGIFLSHFESREASAIGTKLAPELPEGFFGRAARLAESGDFEEAERALNAGLHLDPEGWAGYFIKGLLAWYKNDWQVVGKNMSRCTRLNPDYNAAHFALATALHRQGDLANARREYRIYLGGEELISDYASRSRKAIANIDSRLLKGS